MKCTVIYRRLLRYTIGRLRRFNCLWTGRYVDLPVSVSTFLSVWGFIALVSGLENCRSQKSPFLSVSRNQKHQGTYTETAGNVQFLSKKKTLLLCFESVSCCINQSCLSFNLQILGFSGGVVMQWRLYVKNLNSMKNKWRWGNKLNQKSFSLQPQDQIQLWLYLI